MSRVAWPRTHRIIRSRFPPIDLFEDIAPPEDWDALARAEAKTNPRILEAVGRLDQVPSARRVGGPGASLVMAPFVHCSTDRPSRFSDGTFGVYYAGDRFEVALAETIYHHEALMAATAEPAGWTSQFRELVGRIDAGLHDLRDQPAFAACLDPDDYTAGQDLARRLRGAASDGLVYPSVREQGGACIAAFFPDVVSIPVQGRHLAYHWDGQRVDRVQDLGERIVYAVR
ncbi:RES family NAD+ phosphorylase [Marinivivus vitaminiproducens]|uniref:RES family NAD+ phosphorylase n=1 Tax=Marinivivus vitaminiproducens TaxID=3035935 RepID=UPI00279C0F84|nr:RES family NAD+ phosphorylase [Geminicoccaceae bacterium SCSIO 64248]